MGDRRSQRPPAQAESLDKTNGDLAVISVAFLYDQFSNVPTGISYYISCYLLRRSG